MYDPTVGRFLEEDPIGLDGGDANYYRYAGNSPTNFTDPDGLQANPFGLTTNVLDKDLSVWKANTLKTRYGEFTVDHNVFTEKYQVHGGGARSGVKTSIEFFPNKNCPPCEAITFVQTVHAYYTAGRAFYNPHMKGVPGQIGKQDPVYTNIVRGRTTGKEGKAVKADVMLDVTPGNFPGGKPSIFFPESLIKPWTRQTGFVRPAVATARRSVQSAIMQDIPGVPVGKLPSVTYEFETAAICKSTGRWLGSLRWGFVTPGGNKVKATMLPMSVSDRPSATLLGAVSNMMQIWWPTSFVIRAELNPAPFTSLFPPQYGVRLPLPPPGSSRPPIQRAPMIRIVK